MSIDTVALRSPHISEKLAAHLELQSMIRSCVDASTGELMWEFTTGKLDGSFDSRVSFRVMREEDVVDELTGRVSKVACPPYINVEASLAKFRHGQNVFGSVTGFQDQVCFFLDMLSVMFNEAGSADLEFPEPLDWTVTRVDWAQVFSLPEKAIGDYIHMLRLAKFPRRQIYTYGLCGIYSPGVVTVKIYHKGPEFRAHDLPRLRHSYKAVLLKSIDTSQHNILDSLVDRKMRALQRLANSRLRCEAEIHAKKLRYDFGHLPRVSEVTDRYLSDVWSDQFGKLLKEGAADMEIVRTHEAVKARLFRLCASERSANNLLGFWMRLVAEGEERVQQSYSKTQFYTNKKKLSDMGVSWLSGDVYIVANHADGFAFSPLSASAPRCVTRVRDGSFFAMNALDYARLKAA